MGHSEKGARYRVKLTRPYESEIAIVKAGYNSDKLDSTSHRPTAPAIERNGPRK